MTNNFFHPSLLLLFLDPRFGIQDPGSGMGKNQDPGSGINIPDPQHWFISLSTIQRKKIMLQKLICPSLLKNNFLFDLKIAVKTADCFKTPVSNSLRGCLNLFADRLHVHCTYTCNDGHCLVTCTCSCSSEH